jgi:hypothetical protein
VKSVRTGREQGAVARASATVATFVASLLACATPGYRVEINAKPLSPASGDDVLATLERRAKDEGFSGGARYEGSPGVFVSHYSKQLPGRGRDTIEVLMEYFRADDRIWVSIEDRLRGQEPPVKAQIDSLGDMYTAELGSIVGSEKVSVSRGPTRVPLFQ